MCNKIHRILLLYYLPYADALVLKHHSGLQLSRLLYICSIVTLLACHNSYQLFSIIIYHIPPIIFESESICFGAPKSLILTIVINGKCMLNRNFHAMGGICKEVWHWDLLVKFSFGWIYNLTLGTSWWTLEYSLHRAVIVV